MAYYERVGNLHIHTIHSDGSGRHEQVAQAAKDAGLDFAIVTDHNAYLPHHEGWYGNVLLLVGEEINAPDSPLVNHLLAFNAQEAMTAYGDVSQRLIDAIAERGGLSYIAHPVEKSGAIANEPEINWIDWESDGYTGLELWNYMSEFKAHLTLRMRALLFAFAPKLAITGPFPETLRRWDALLATRPVYIIGGSDAHAQSYRMGPLTRCVFPYRHLFRQVNTHVLVREPWSGDASRDAMLIYEALGSGRAFVGYDGLAPTRGFRFEACDGRRTYAMGACLVAEGKLRWQIEAPVHARLRLLRDGQPIDERYGKTLEYAGGAPGAYRVEAYRRYAGRWRGWVFTNPIFLRQDDVVCEAGRKEALEL